MSLKKQIIEYRFLSYVIVLALLMTSCARMGAPDGGWYDEQPPRVIGATPQDRGTNVTSRKISIYFNEFIKMDNVAEKVVISPPQLEQPTIKTTGKSIFIQLMDTLKDNTTYTVDFSDAISDNNEGNPMGSYTYSFSTGDHIDTLEVSGYVLNASDLEPVKGILVGLLEPTPTLEGDQRDRVLSEDVSNTDSLPHREGGDGSFLRVSRSDSRGHFVIRGVAPGNYRIAAVMDNDGDYRFTNRGEKVAFTDRIVSPSVFTDRRQDTIWQDELHIKDIQRVSYQHYIPDDIVLCAFDHTMTDRYFIKAERKEPQYFTMFFTAPVPKDTIQKLPLLRLLNIPQSLPQTATAEELFIAEPSQNADTVTYWLRDTLLVNQDTLRMEMQTLITDTLGNFVLTTDTIEVLSKQPYAKRLKEQREKEAEWKKDVEKKRKRAQDDPTIVVDSIMPVEPLQVKFNVPQSITPDQSLHITFPAPLQHMDSTAIHLYVEQDSLWYRAPLTLERLSLRQWEAYSDWIPGAEYSFEVDSLAFEDIYGNKSRQFKTGLNISMHEDFSTLFVNITAPVDSVPIIVELLDNGDRPQRTVTVENGTAEFYYLNGGTYYMRAFLDRNGNGKWDTGDYLQGLQPEEVYYYPGAVECKAKWDITKSWNLTAKPLEQQKPGAITKQKAEAARQVQSRNAQRAAEKGIPLPPHLQR